MKNVIIFDMDDTLYDEFTYVKSGFKAVSQYIARKTSQDASPIFHYMWKKLQQDGRGRIFNDALEYFDLERLCTVESCVEVYRYHTPSITLPIETIEVLETLQNYPLYVVTDGYVPTQERKIKALRLSDYFKRTIPSYQKNIAHGKPSPYWFQEIAKWEKVNPQQIVYIGDNANKDFIGIKPLGFRTIRVRTGEYKNIVPSMQHEAEIVIDQLKDLRVALKALWPKFQ